MAKGETQFLAMLLIGFVAFSLPLLFHDTQQLWGTPAVPEPAADAYPPGPPPWHSYEDDDAGAQFRRAVGDGDMAKVEELWETSMKSDPPVDLVTAQHWHGATPLFEAARSGHMKMAEWLVAKGADPDKANEWGDTAANEAASMGHWDIVWYLADNGANLMRTVEHTHTTLVLSAVRHKSKSALIELKRRGIDLSHRSWNGATPMHEAARMGEAELIDWFLTESSVDLNATNDSGETAVHEAATMGHMEVVWKLINAGVGLGEAGSAAAHGLLYSAIQHHNLELLTLLRDRGLLDINNAGYNRSPLIEAVRTERGGGGNDLAVVDFLLAAGVNASVQAPGGESAVSVAAFENHFKYVWRLQQAGASLHVSNEYGGTILMSAVHFGHEDEAKRLVNEFGLDVNAHNNRGDTPLTLASSRPEPGGLQLVQTLVGLGATADARGSRRDTPLHRAAKFHRGEIARYLLANRLLDREGGIDAPNRKGDTPLFEACRAGAHDVAKLLLDNGASVTHANKAGLTPLLEPAESGQKELVSLLLEQPNVDVHAKTPHGEGALELAKWSHEADEIAAMLKAHGAVEVEPREPRVHGDDDPEA